MSRKLRSRKALNRFSEEQVAKVASGCVLGVMIWIL